ncbi:MAG TPA: chemotaxis protein CheB [Pseudonocardiaceae bacterium]|nr:chemotaxis protein CheB [Pseudonocardiaceae bacterium]
MTEPSDLVVVGASAGGVEALREFAAGLPADLPAAVLVVLHLPAGGVSALASILSRSGPLPAVPAVHDTPLEAGRIHTAVPDRHLLVADSRVVLSRGPTENGHRPAIDALFRTAAVNWGARTVGVVLSGTLDDGAAGLVAIKSRGGVAVVQDPAEALYRGMPDSALAMVTPDHVLRARDMGAVLLKILQERVVPEAAPSRMDTVEARIEAGAMADYGDIVAVTEPSGLSCPDCQGVLFTVEADRRFRCRVGHAWTAMALLAQQDLELEKALWTALRALEEKRQLADRMSTDAMARGQELVARRYAEHMHEVDGAAVVLRRLLLDGSA